MADDKLAEAAWDERVERGIKAFASDYPSYITPADAALRAALTKLEEENT